MVTKLSDLIITFYCSDTRRVSVVSLGTHKPEPRAALAVISSVMCGDMVTSDLALSLTNPLDMFVVI